MIKNNVIYREFNERHINVMEITEKIITRNNNTLKIIALIYTAENWFNTLKFFGKKKVSFDQRQMVSHLSNQILKSLEILSLLVMLIFDFHCIFQSWL